ncbi:hypothetical protein ASPBRDRAFT_45887 [Aspergillus brasiliensis CBS 101740]|uniref:Peptidase C14 caspase domain-containing protein n=1 Tax=Aspergillus brasiliensis (strain CBS 101740 / IMI 381727 / IBT 21946) TaxID=767769 RepID=A0A1L9UCZ2_ASPBC|nr:hypothetical protein ASPBRDRAFT_45887 [Aspergillus brasiliensis CBS 101740]
MARWALLIGVDFYETRSLQGCVNDVRIMKHYIEANVTDATIATLTASSPKLSNSQRPIEDPGEWPTLSNILNCLEAIISASRPGDLVYIHYSGHGARLKTPTCLDYGHKNTGDVALIVLGESAIGNAEFQGFALANYLKRMVTKGLLVTLVLDCCFSGHVYRQDEDQLNRSIRTLNDLSELDQPSSSHTRSCGGANDTFRDAQLLPRWLIDPEGYIIITACGPHETAQEVVLSGRKHGILSYHLHQALTTLKRYRAQITHQSLLNYLVTRVHSVSRQTPMRYGSLRFCFFEEILPGLMTDFLSVSDIDNQIILEAGMAHGVYLGDEYAIYPFSAPEDVTDPPANSLFRAKVRSVNGLSSVLEAVSPIQRFPQGADGWKARSVIQCSPRRIYVGLMPGVTNQLEWIHASSNRPFLQISELPTNPACDFFVKAASNGYYRVLDSAGQVIPSLPPITVGADNDVGSIIDVLAHLAKFKYIEGIEVPSTQGFLQPSFHLTLEDETGLQYQLDRPLDINDKQDLILTVTNLNNDQPLYVTVLNFTPLWQIHCLTGDASNAGFTVIPPRDVRNHCTGGAEVAWEMNIPEILRASGQCEDVIKIIVTNRATSFHSLLLPKITELLGNDDHGQDQEEPASSQRAGTTSLPDPAIMAEEVDIFTVKIRTHC